MHSFAPSKADLTAVEAIGAAPDKATYPNLARYFTHIKSFKAAQTKKWTAGSYTHKGDWEWADSRS